MKKPSETIKTGFPAFDKLTGGLKRGELVCIASAPGQGKTALVQNIVAQVALKKNVPVLFFSLDMNRHEIMQRFVAAEASVNLRDIHTGFFKRDRWQDITSAVSRFIEAPLFINDASGKTDMDARETWHELIDLLERLVHGTVSAKRRPADINRSLVMTASNIRILSKLLQRRLRKEGKELGLIVIDELQLLLGAGLNREERRHGVSVITRALKYLARELNVPVIVLAQLSRHFLDMPHRDNKPKLSDLSESDALGKGADLVVLLHREGYYKRIDPTLEDKAELIVAKNPRGKIGTVTVKMMFEREYVRFSAPTRSRPPEQGPRSPEHGPFTPF